MNKINLTQIYDSFLQDSIQNQNDSEREAITSEINHKIKTITSLIFEVNYVNFSINLLNKLHNGNRAEYQARFIQSTAEVGRNMNDILYIDFINENPNLFSIHGEVEKKIIAHLNETILTIVSDVQNVLNDPTAPSSLQEKNYIKDFSYGKRDAEIIRSLYQKFQSTAHQPSSSGAVFNQ